MSLVFTPGQVLNARDVNFYFSRQVATRYHSTSYGLLHHSPDALTHTLTHALSHLPVCKETKENEGRKAELKWWDRKDALTKAKHKNRKKKKKSICHV